MSINLLPPQVKKERISKKWIHVCLGYFAFLCIILIAIGVLTFLTNIYLEKDLERTEADINQQIEISKQYKETESLINETNAKLEKISAKNTDKPLWSEIIKEIQAVTPENLQIFTLTLDKESSRISITGIAQDRSEIAKLKEKMEYSAFFKNINFTSSAYNEQEKTFSYNLFGELEKTK